MNSHLLNDSSYNNHKKNENNLRDTKFRTIHLSFKTQRKERKAREKKKGLAAVQLEFTVEIKQKISKVRVRVIELKMKNT